MTTTAADTVAERVLAGSHQAMGRMLSGIERRAEGVNEALATLHHYAGGAHVLGITGPPGSGKSTLVTALTAHYREAGYTVGILAVDPSSALSGGAILGDRIRMSSLAGDTGVFIRSIATRGALGGLSRAALDAVTVLDAAGKDIVILETVGAGQAEVDVISAAQTVAVVSVPGMGDDIQAIKAGLLEIADVHIVNKADYPGTHKTVSELREMLRLSKRAPKQWNVPIQQTVAATREGIPELVDTFTGHRQWLADSGEDERRERRGAAMRIRWMAEELLLAHLKPGEPAFDTAVDEVIAKDSDPASAATTLLARAGAFQTGKGTR